MSPHGVLERRGDSCGSLFPRGNIVMLFILWMALFVYPTVNSLFYFPANPGSFLGTIVTNMFLVLLTGNTARDAFCKPFAYFLPGHRTRVRRHILVIGLAYNLFFLLFTLRYPVTGALNQLSATIALFGLGMSFYLGMSLMVIRMKDPTITAFLPWLFWLMLMVNEQMGMTSLAIQVVRHPVLMLLSTLLLLYWYWQVFSQRAWFRSLVGTPYLNFTDGMSPAKASRFYEEISAQRKAARLRKQGIQPRLDATRSGSFGHARMSCFQRELFLRWRNLGEKLQSPWILGGWIFNVVFIGAFIVFAGHTNPFITQTMLFMFANMCVFFQDTRVRLSPFLPYNRQGKMRATWLLNLVLAGTVCLGALIARELLILIYRQLDMSIANIYTPRAILYCSLMMPLALYLKLWLRKDNALGALALFGAFAFNLWTYLLIARSFLGYEQASFTTILAFHLVTWGWYWLALGQFYLKQDLIPDAE